MGQASIIEFYLKDRCISRVESSMVLPVGSCISIEKITYKVTRITFAVDHNSSVVGRQLRCNVDLKKWEEK
jgi:phosphotransferase system IIB component